MNEYQKAHLEIAAKSFWDGLDQRRVMVERYSWAIPNDQAINEIVKYSPIIEIGAGSGYWASLITKAGGDIICYDSTPPGRKIPNTYGHKEVHHPVEKGTPRMLSKHADRTLMLCWPPLEPSLFGGGSTMGATSLKQYKGKHVIYIGESEGGCTGGPAMWEILNEKFDLIADFDIPNWSGMHDRLHIYRRTDWNVATKQGALAQPPPKKEKITRLWFVKELGTAPDSQLDAEFRKECSEFDGSSEEALKLLTRIFEADETRRSRFVEAAVNPRYTKDYP